MPDAGGAPEPDTRGIMDSGQDAAQAEDEAGMEASWAEEGAR